MLSRTLRSYLRSGRRAGRFARFGVVACTGVIGTSVLLVRPVLHADSAAKEYERPPLSRQPTPWTSLLRSYAVYSMISVPLFVDYSPAILSALTSVPVLRELTLAFVRATFFSQFVGGDTAEDALPLLDRLRADGIGGLFAYSVEVDEAEATGKGKVERLGPAHKQTVEEMIHSIDMAAYFEGKLQRHVSDSKSGRTWVALKFSALVPDAQSLIKLSTHIIRTRSDSSSVIPFPGIPMTQDLDIIRTSTPPVNSTLSAADISALRELYSDLLRICKRAQERGVKIIVDAEHTWYQPAIDAYTLSLMQEFNKLPPSRTRSLFSWARTDTPPGHVQPLVYATYQAYLRRTRTHLEKSIQFAKVSGFALGVKLVRGAYHPYEVAAHQHRSPSTSPSQRQSISESVPVSISPDVLPPVWLSKAETDACYNACATLLVDAVRSDVQLSKKPLIPGIAVLFGTHNSESCQLILERLVEARLAHPDGEKGVVTIGDDVAERIMFGQLYGMSDALTYDLVEKTRSSTPIVMKYVPYGALSEVMPYLSRRAIENKSVLGDGGATKERQRAGAEIRKYIFG